MTVRLRVFDDELLNCSKSGTVWGRIYFDVGDSSFPDKGWSDMAVAVASAWLSGLIEVASIDSQKDRVYFMDGPASVEVTLGRNGLVNLDFLHKDSVKYSAKESLDGLLQDAIFAGDHLLTICKNHGWYGISDTEKLTLTVHRGREVLENLRRGRSGLSSL